MEIDVGGVVVDYGVVDVVYCVFVDLCRYWLDCVCVVVFVLFWVGVWVGWRMVGGGFVGG